MLVATFATTLLSGLALTYGGEATVSTIMDAFTFPAALLSMLIAHEMGHYLACRHHGLDATLPMFIPAPPFPIAIGTFGAFIRIRSAIRKRAKLLDVGAAGPLAGVVFALLWSAVGIALSRVEPVSAAEGSLEFGESLFFWLMRLAILGPIPEGSGITMHPMALAGWLGLFVTSLNLLMAGQLDGGHIVHALFGRRHRWISRMVFVCLITWGAWGDPLLEDWWAYPFLFGLPVWAFVLSLWTMRRKVARTLLIGPVLLYVLVQMVAGAGSASTMWLVWGMLVFAFGLDHPPIADPGLPLSLWRWAVGLLSLVVLVGTFIPMPITVVM